MCDCIEQLNKRFEEAEENMRIFTPVVLSLSTGELSSQHRATIVVEKRNTKNRKKPKKLYASYCPFCGNKYQR